MDDKNPQTNNIGKIKEVEITEEMKEAYLDYAMSVIVSRALPDVRDGLKPVHRRILFAMNSLGLNHTAKFKKSAAVVGEVISKYHPHGDVAIYDSMVRMAQDFSLRYPLVWGQGNFGSIDGDSAAAYRYTEARMRKIASEMIDDIEKDTVDFQDNYDGTRKEPKVLPSKIPQMLLNGSVGIAVGMATNIPPHNLSELIDGITHLINHPKATNEDLLQFVKGPDFPTGGILYNQKDISSAYSLGKGPMVVRGRAEILEVKNGKFQIIVSEIPYQVNKSTLIEKIAHFVQEKRIEGIRDIRDESDREGMRIVIDLKGGAYPQKVLNKLYKYTDLQKTFHMNMLALIDGIQPRVLSLRVALEQFVFHRREVVRRRTEFDLKKAKDRAHILDGLKKALDHIDKIIKTIRSSETKEIAHKQLMKVFSFTAVQTAAILEMKLQQLAGLERKKIEDELKEKKKLIKELALILKDPKLILGIIKDELAEVKEKYGDERRTLVVKKGVSEFREEDLIPSEDAVVILTHGGYVKRIKPEAYKVQKRGGKGVIGTATREEDAVEQFLTTNTHDNILFFTNKGKVYQLRVFDIPESARTSKGKPIVNVLDLAPGESVTAVVSYGKEEKGNGYFVMATKNGIIKKTEAKNFQDVRRSGIISINLKGDDVLKWVKPSFGSDEVVMVTKMGQAIRFSEKDVRPMGRSAAGVTAIRLKKEDEVVGMDVINVKLKTKNEKEKDKILVIMENGFGKRTDLSQYKIQGRGGSGIKTANVTEKTGGIVASKVLGAEEEDLIAISQKGQAIRVPINNISVLSRATQGVKIMKMDKEDKVASITTV